jgi:hypothetical protein
LWCSSMPFLFSPYTPETHPCSNGLHTSYDGGPLHYTLFGFREGEDGALEQGWAVHLNEDGSSGVVLRSRKRRIFRGNITYLFNLFVRMFLTQIFYALFLLLFSRGPLLRQPQGSPFRKLKCVVVWNENVSLTLNYWFKVLIP